MLAYLDWELDVGLGDKARQPYVPERTSRRQSQATQESNLKKLKMQRSQSQAGHRQATDRPQTGRPDQTKD
jgi:hypothetical protein